MDLVKCCWDVFLRGKLLLLGQRQRHQAGGLRISRSSRGGGAFFEAFSVEGAKNSGLFFFTILILIARAEPSRAESAAAAATKRDLSSGLLLYDFLFLHFPLSPAASAAIPRFHYSPLCTSTESADFDISYPRWSVRRPIRRDAFFASDGLQQRYE